MASSLIHPTAIVDETCEIGDGTRIGPFTHIHPGARIGCESTIGQGVMVGPEVTVGDRCDIGNNVTLCRGSTLESDVYCGPSVAFARDLRPHAKAKLGRPAQPVIIHRGAKLGASTVIIGPCEIGEYAVIESGSIVRVEVLPYALMRGDPAERADWRCKCGRGLIEFHAGVSECIGCDRRYVKVGSRVSLEREEP